MSTSVVPRETRASARRARTDRRTKSIRRWFVQQELPPWLYGTALALWASSWDLHRSVLLGWLPLEPVWVASLLLGACVVHRLGQPLVVSPRVVGPLALVMVCFLPGALRVNPEGYGPEKVAQMLLVVLPVVLAATVLLDSPAARRAWAIAQMLVGTAVAVAALTTNHVNASEPGRFTLATVNTIGTARFIGIAVVVLVLLAATSARRAWWALPAGVLCATVLVRVGSRGPLLFALAAIALVLIFSRCFDGRRAVPMCVAVLFAGMAYVYAADDGGDGGRRVVDSLRAGLLDDARSAMLGDAVRAGVAHPLGVGWGDFLRYSDTAARIANDDGVSYAHNLFAEAFSEGGIPALVGLVLLVALALKRQWLATAHPPEAVVWGTLAFWLLNALVSLDLVWNRFMWIALACALVSSTPPRSGDHPYEPREVTYGSGRH